MPASAEIIDFVAVRERRLALAQARKPEAAQPVMAWVPVWFYAPVWMGVPVSAGWRVNA